VSTQEIDFTAGTDSHPNDAHVETPGRVRQVAVPPAARTLGTLSHVDREDTPPRLPAELPAELLGKRQQQALLVATFAQQENQIARAVWAGVAPVHRQVVRYLLERAGRRIREKE
jgi:hypothetical protein